MAKGKYQEWLKPDGLLRIAAWARDGLSEDQIAKDKMGISRSKLSEWKIKYKDIADALKKTKEIADIKVENVLYEAALRGEAWAVCFWLKTASPNNGAISRKNRSIPSC